MVGISRATVSGIENNRIAELGIRKYEKLLNVLGHISCSITLAGFPAAWARPVSRSSLNKWQMASVELQLKCVSIWRTLMPLLISEPECSMPGIGVCAAACLMKNGAGSVSGLPEARPARQGGFSVGVCTPGASARGHTITNYSTHQSGSPAVGRGRELS